MNSEERIIWEKPLFSLKLERGQRGAYGWEIKVTGPDLKSIKKEIQETNQWCMNLEKEIREDTWKVKEVKQKENPNG